MLGLDLYYDAFQDLNTCRTSGFGAGPIPWSAIRDYGVTFEFDDDQMEDLFHFIRVLDNAFLEYHSPKGGATGWQAQKTQDNSRGGWKS